VSVVGTISKHIINLVDYPAPVDGDSAIEKRWNPKCKTFSPATLNY